MKVISSLVIPGKDTYELSQISGLEYLWLHSHLGWILWIGSAYALGHVRDSIPVPPKSSASLNRQGTDSSHHFLLLREHACS